MLLVRCLDIDNNKNYANKNKQILIATPHSRGQGTTSKKWFK